MTLMAVYIMFPIREQPNAERLHLSWAGPVIVERRPVFPPGVIAFVTGLRDHRRSRRELGRYSSLPLPLLSQPKADTSRVIIVDE